MSALKKSIKKCAVRLPGIICAFAVAAIFFAELVLPPVISVAGIGILRKVAASSCSTLFIAADGKTAGAFPSAEGEWRLRIPGSIPSEVELVFTAVEDWRFREHCGVDFLAVFRAAGQNMTSGTIISGASTITMQLARCLDYRRRSWSGKIRETLRALALEKYFTKDEIFRMYLDNLPFGGRIYGLETAARYYFGTTTGDLTIEQLSLLAGIPQRPNGFRPDKYPQAAARRRLEVISLLEYHEVISPQKAEEMKKRLVLPTPGQIPGDREAEELQSYHYCLHAAREHGGKSALLNVNLDTERQIQVLRLARESLARLRDVNDSAVVVIDNHTMQVIVLLGGVDYFSANAGMVDAAGARRSPGSLLKPFIYGCALKKGFIVPDSTMYDGKSNFNGYVPENFDRDFSGYMTAANALAESRNIPAVQLLAEVGLDDWFAALNEYGFAVQKKTDTGLGAALGGGMEISPLEAAAAFAALANDGVYCRPLFLQNGAADKKRIWSTSTVFLLNSMLRRPLPGAPGIDAAWKTGTSQGRRDAWCAAWDRDFTVVVWLGNKNGAPAAGLTGVDAAAPLAGKILAMVHGRQAQTEWTAAEEAGIKNISMCAESGLRAGTLCRNLLTVQAAESIPLRLCRECAAVEKREKAVIAAPAAGKIFAGKNGSAAVDFAADIPYEINTGENGVLWFINGIFSGNREKFTLSLEPGGYEITAYFPAEKRQQTVQLTVVPGK